jgi:sugar/nucleoside kinase (ribokinase family)
MHSVDPILIVGSMAFDDLELPSGSFNDVVGGAATYAAYAASLYAPTQLVAVVGSDFPQPVLDDLARRGASTEGVTRESGKTFRWAGRYSSNLASRTTLDTQLNVFADFKPELPESFRDARWVLLGNIHPALQLAVLEQARAARFVAADTMNFWIEGERDALLKVLARIDLLVINDEELRQLADTHNIQRAARAVLALGPKRLIVKRGEYGAMLFDGDQLFFSPAYPLEEEVDPTGAGDTFAGALVGSLAAMGGVNHQGLRRAVVNAATVASYCVEGVGTARLRDLHKHHLSERIESLRSITRCSD